MNGSDKNPAKAVDLLNKNNIVQRPLTKDEYPRLAQALAESSNPHLQYIVLLLLLTGTRRGEVLTARWKDFDLKNFSWTIPMTKTGRPHTVQLTERIIQVLSAIGTQGKSEYLFPSHTGKPYISIFHAWNKARKKAGVPDLRMHDLRHSFASALINQGHSLYAVQKLLGHTQVKTTQRYAHFQKGVLKSATEAAGNMYAALDKQSPAVLPAAVNTQSG